MTDPHDRTVHQALIDTYAALSRLMLNVDDDVCSVLGDIVEDFWTNWMGEEDRRIARTMEEDDSDDDNDALSAYLQKRCDDVMPGAEVCESSTGHLILQNGNTLVEGTWLELYRWVADAADHRIGPDDSFEVHAAYLVAEATKILPDADIGVGRTGVVGQYTLDVGDTAVVQGSWLDLYEHVAARRPTVLGERG